MAHALADRAPSLLLTVVVALLASSLLRVWLGWLRVRGKLSIETGLVHACSEFLFRRVGALPFQEHQQRGLGELLQGLGSAEALTRALASIGVAPLVEALGALAYLLVLFTVSPAVGVPLLGLALVSAVITLLLARRYARCQAQELTEAARSRARLHELLAGIATLKAEHAERAGMLRWLHGLLGERGVALSKDLTDAWLSLWLGGVERVGRLGVLGWAAFEVLAQRMSVPELVYVGMLSEGFLYAMTTLCRTLTMLGSARTHLARVDELLAVEPVVRTRGSARGQRHDPELLAVQLSDVWFRHGADQPWLLQGYNLTLRQGEHLDLRGRSGLGKTTILRLIAGLYRPERGNVSVLGRDPYRDQACIAYLPQHAQLLSGSLRDNLSQLSGASLERVMAACAATGLVAWLQSLPMGLETVVAAGGANLSGGQRQWIVLTAAVASERPVLLMDESLSQLDHLVRSQLSVDRLFAGKTTIRVTHDS
jgi:ABC-type bacteriocin/lantibiotic exporter with double-glycine peptidase domain